LEEGPRALFDRAVLWQIEHRVLLPGITVLARLVAEVRSVEHDRVRAAEIKGLGAGALFLPDVAPAKVAAPCRYGLGAKARALRELSATRRAATLPATVRQLEVDAVDDAIDLFDLLMATKLLARAERLSNEAKLQSLPALRRGRSRGRSRCC
jgi:hypothetical protein